MSNAAPYFVHVGGGNIVNAERTTAVLVPGTTTTKMYIENAKKTHKLIDTTRGKSILSILLIDDGSVVLSHVTPSTLLFRLTNILSPRGTLSKNMFLEEMKEDETD